MQKYKYTAVNLQKHKIRGVFIARDKEDLAQQLAKQSLFLISAKPYATPSNSIFSFENKVTVKELTGFSRQYAIMLSTHIPILDCLDILKNQPFTAYFRSVISVIHEDVQGGMLLSEAMDKHQRIFPDFFRSMVKVGELSGHLDLMFISLADYYEKELEMRRKIKSAMAYPVMLMGMTVGIVILMLAVVVPTFRETLSRLGVEPEGLTAAVYAISDFLLAWWKIILLVILSIALLICIMNRTEKGRYIFDVLKLKGPIIGTIQINTITSRFARAFSLLLSSGLDLNEALYATEIVLGNRYLEKRFNQAAEAVRGGMSLTNAFESGHLFPAMLIQMITIGEKTNALSEVLTRSCKFFDDQVEESVNSLTNKLQPIMLIIMGSVVCVLFLAVYSPILSIMNGLNI